MAEKTRPLSEDKPANAQGNGAQAGQQVRLHIDEQKMTSTYANAFRTNGTAEEVMIDFGLNLVAPPATGAQGSDILFHVNNRVILNYYSAKRLAITLSQLVRRHEEQFGELELDAAKRIKAAK